MPCSDRVCGIAEPLEQCGERLPLGGGVRAMLRVTATLSASDGTNAGAGDATRSERKFGELLIEEAAITREQLEEALRVQSLAASLLPLGQVLLNRGRLTRSLLTTLLRRHNKSARLGELLVRAGQITTDQLQSALDQQAQTAAAPGPHADGARLRQRGNDAQRAVRPAAHQLLRPRYRPDRSRPWRGWSARSTPTRRRVVPLFRAGSLLVIAVDDPTDATGGRRICSSCSGCASRS